MTRPPWLALTVGDPAGIGPEIVRRALEAPEVRAAARVVVLGPGFLRPAGIPALFEAPSAADLAHREGPALWLDTGPPRATWPPGAPHADAGAAAIAALRAGATLATARAVEALVTAPVSKEGLHLAGERVEGQTELLARWADAPDVAMLAVAHRLRVLLLTRHLPLVHALAEVTAERVLVHLELLDRGLRGLGFPRPRLALAGLNPHAGENGLLGREELDVLVPAVADARSRGLDVAGPLSPDTVFLRASRGEFDAVLALYHDQAFIPVKLHAPDTGLTVLVGLPYLRVSPAHGTAYDRVGTGTARADNLVHALVQASELTVLRAGGAGGALARSSD